MGTHGVANKRLAVRHVIDSAQRYVFIHSIISMAIFINARTFTFQQKFLARPVHLDSYSRTAGSPPFACARFLHPTKTTSPVRTGLVVMSSTRWAPLQCYGLDVKAEDGLRSAIFAGTQCSSAHSVVTSVYIFFGHPQVGGLTRVHLVCSAKRSSTSVSRIAPSLHSTSRDGLPTARSI